MSDTTNKQSENGEMGTKDKSDAVSMGTRVNDQVESDTVSVGTKVNVPVKSDAVSMETKVNVPAKSDAVSTVLGVKEEVVECEDALSPESGVESAADSSSDSEENGKTSSEAIEGALVDDSSPGMDENEDMITTLVPTSDGALELMYKCEQCHYCTHKKHYLKQHVDLVHSNHRPFKCPFCDYAGKRSHSLKQHLVVHSNDRPYECSDCNASFRKKAHLTNHMRLHTHQCPLCHIKEIEASRLCQHLRSQHPKEAYACDICQFATTDPSNIVMHMHHHGNPKIFKCGSCEHVAVHVNLMKQHLLQHVPEASYTVETNTSTTRPAILMKCAVCGFTTDKRKVLQSHMLDHIHQQEVDPEQESSSAPLYKCVECNVVCQKARQFLQHVTSCHQGAASIGDAQKVIESQQGSGGESRVVATPNFLYDPAAGLYRCTLCCYTCEHQRTIKGHIWKHSGHKDIDYPMFQNGPISIYDDTPIGQAMLVRKDNAVAVKTEAAVSDPVKQENSKPQISIVTASEGVAQPPSATVQSSGDDHSNPGSSTSDISGDHVYHSVLKETPAAIQDQDAQSQSVKMLLSLKIKNSQRGKPVISTAHTDLRNQIKLATQAPDLRSQMRQLNKSPALPIVMELQNGKKVVLVPKTSQKKVLPFSTSQMSTVPDSNVITAKSVDGALGHVEAAQSHKTLAKAENESQVTGASSAETVPQESLPPQQEMTGAECDGIMDTEAIKRKATDDGNGINKRHHVSAEDSIECLPPQQPNVVVEAVRQIYVSPAVISGDLSDLPRPASVESQGSSSNEIPYTDNNVVLEEMCTDSSVVGSLECPQVGNVEEVCETAEATSDSVNVNSVNGRSAPRSTRATSSYPVTRSATASRNRTTSATSEEMVTLLSLLKKGPNYNPACPGNTAPPVMTVEENVPMDTDVSTEDSQVDVESVDSANHTSSEDLAGKPKQGICSSLLAVIEQLRERSKSEDSQDSMDAMERTLMRPRQRLTVDEEDNSIEEHPDVEPFGEEYRCRRCHYTSVSPGLMRTHLRMHKEKRPFECSLCDYQAESNVDLQAHTLQHCKVRTYMCRRCHAVFHYKSQLRAHMRAHERAPLLCRLCSFQTSDPLDYRSHMQSHVDETSKPVKTEENAACEIVVKKESNEEPTIRESEDGTSTLEVGGEDEGSYRCKTCGKKTATMEEMDMHMDVQHVKHKKVYECADCDFSCTNFAKAKKHCRLHVRQTPVVPMYCKLCDFTAVSTRSLKSHMKRHANDARFVQHPLEQYKCRLCGYVCYHLPSLKAHMWRHASHDAYSYEHTNYIINAATDQADDGDSIVAQRMVAVAEGASNCLVTFRCFQCGFETINKSVLNTHMQDHLSVIQHTLDVNNTAVKPASERN